MIQGKGARFLSFFHPCAGWPKKNHHQSLRMFWLFFLQEAPKIKVTPRFEVQQTHGASTLAAVTDQTNERHQVVGDKLETEPVTTGSETVCHHTNLVELVTLHAGYHVQRTRSTRRNSAANIRAHRVRVGPDENLPSSDVGRSVWSIFTGHAWMMVGYLDAYNMFLL